MDTIETTRQNVLASLEIDRKHRSIFILLFYTAPPKKLTLGSIRNDEVNFLWQSSLSITINSYSTCRYKRQRNNIRSKY